MQMEQEHFSNSKNCNQHVLTWFYIPDIPANEEVDGAVYGHHDEGPVYAEVSGDLFLQVVPLHAPTGLLQVGECQGRRVSGCRS